MHTSIGAIALVVMLVTTALFTWVGLVHTSRQTIDLETYMVSRNRTGTGMAIATIVASAMGAWILFSPPEVGATSGIAGILGYCLGQAAPAGMFAWIGVRTRHLMPAGHSLNEYVLHRYGNVMYVLTLAIIAFYMFVYLTAELTAIAKAVELLAGIPLLWTALVVIVAVFAYTTVGGLEATIFTDVVQFLVIVPLLVLSLGLTVVALGGWSAAIAPVQANAPQLLSLSHGAGIKFGLTLVIAILAAEMFNQANWQRVYACKSDQVVRRSFLGSSLIIMPLLLIAGLLGMLGMHFGFNDDRAFFSLIQALQFPTWALVLVLVLALALVMSSLDTLLNGIASLCTTDIMRLWPALSSPRILQAARIITVVIGIPAIAIAAQGYNVLYLFLLADLVCAGALFPVLYGLYSRRMTGAIAVLSSGLGIGTGVLFFPKPDFSPWLTTIPGAGDLLISFTAPIVVSAAICLGWSAWQRHTNSPHWFDFNTLNQRIQKYD